MKRLVIIMFSLLFVLCGCKDAGPEPQTMDPGDTDVSDCRDTRHELENRSISEADFALMMEGYYLEFMGADYTAAFGVNWVDITPDDVYERIGCQVFKDGVNCQSFLAYQGEIYDLPGFFGGFGISSLHACDFYNSGSYDLIYATSWGSGLHRSEIWIFDFSRLEPQMIRGMIVDEDIVLCKDSDQRFVVISAELDYERIRIGGYADLSIFVPQRIIGSVEVRDGTPVCTLNSL